MSSHAWRLFFTVLVLVGAGVLALPAPAAAALDQYLHTQASADILDQTTPVASTAQFKDSAPVNRTTWQPIGTWTTVPMNQAVRLEGLTALHVWLGLKNSDDQGTWFDLQAELHKNGTVIAFGELKAIQGVTRNPDQAKEVLVNFGAVSNPEFNSGDVLSLRLLTKIADSGGHANAVGLRAYYDAFRRPARFGATWGVVAPPSALQIAITSPLSGATVPEGVLLIQGTVQALGEVGVSVNGFPALLQDDKWAVEIPVGADTQVLTGTATQSTGGSATTSVSIVVSPTEGQLLTVRGEPTDGVPPLTVTWRVTNHTSRSLVQYELDATGTGAFGPPAVSLDGSQTIYQTPGLWFPTLRATDDQGATYTATTVVLVLDPAAVAARFQGFWTHFTARLQAGDIAGALEFLTPGLQPRFESVFQQLGTALPGIAAGLGSLHATHQAGDLAEGVVVQGEPGGPALYFIHFRRDGLGRWLIEEM